MFWKLPTNASGKLLLPNSLKHWMAGSSSGSFRESYTHLFFEILTNFSPESTAEKLWSPVSPWHLGRPMMCTLSTTSISLYLLPFPVRNLRLVTGGIQDDHGTVDQKETWGRLLLLTRHIFLAIYFYQQKPGLDRELKYLPFHAHVLPWSLAFLFCFHRQQPGLKNCLIYLAKHG